MSAKITDSASDTQREEKIPDETAPLDSTDASASKQKRISRWLLFGSVAAVVLNILWTCTLVSTQVRPVPDFLAFTDTLIDTVNQFKV